MRLNNVYEPPSYEEAVAMDKPTYKLQKMTKLPFSLRLQNAMIDGHSYSTNGKCNNEAHRTVTGTEEYSSANELDEQLPSYSEALNMEMV